MNKLYFLIFILSGLVFTNTFAESREEAEKNINKIMAALLPGEPVDQISATPFENLYEVVIGPHVLYVSSDGRYILRGDLLDMQERINISEIQRSKARKEIFASLDSNEFIEFGPENPQNIIYVFTDIDCAYCRRLHRDVPVLNKGGLSVRYLAFPRGGMGSKAANKMQAVWCSEDRKKALTDAKNGKQIVSKQCPNPVEREYMMGQQFGIHGTPAIYTKDGRELSGYVPPNELLNIVNN